MSASVISLSDYRTMRQQSISDREVHRISEEVGESAVKLVDQFAQQYPDLPDTFFAFLINQQLLSTACSGAERGHEGSKRLLSHAMRLLNVYEDYLNTKGQSFNSNPIDCTKIDPQDPETELQERPR
jgi:hypothetical protein